LRFLRDSLMLVHQTHHCCDNSVFNDMPQDQFQLLEIKCHPPQQVALVALFTRKASVVWRSPYIVSDIPTPPPPSLYKSGAAENW
jgi:hypothetical protein